jgi:uncharacterized protein (DUF2062 family)
MPKRTLRKWIPTPAALRKQKALHIFGDWIYEGNLWHLNRYSASMGFFVGLFMAFMPIPGQMIVAAAMAVWLRCNLPLSVSLVWITNPVTMPPIFFFAYELGAFLLGENTQALNFELSFEWLFTTLGAVWQPFLLGCTLFSIGFGALGYFLVDILWKMQVRHKWKERQRQRQL